MNLIVLWHYCSEYVSYIIAKAVILYILSVYAHFIWKNLFHVVSYQLTDGRIDIKTLNTDLIDDELKTTEQLKKTFLKHKNNKNIFRDPVAFRKIKNQPAKPGIDDSKTSNGEIL